MKVKVHWVIDGIAEVEAENLEDAIERLRIILPEYLVNGDGIEFTNVVKMLAG